MTRKLLRAEDIAQILNISKPQAFLMMRRGDFPVVRMGRLVRVREEDVDEYINQQVDDSFKNKKSDSLLQQ